MKFEETFLEHTEQQKFNLFRILKTSADESLTIHDMSQRINLSYQQTYSTFQAILKDMALICGNEWEENFSVFNLNAMTFKISLDTYRNYLIRQSVAFSFFDYLVQDENADVNEFCDSHRLSRSTLARKVANLRTLLLAYQLDVSVSKAKLIGDEKRLREFIVCIYYIAFRNIGWPLTYIEEVEANVICEEAILHDMAPRDDNFLAKLRIGVSLARMRQHHLLSDSKRLSIITGHNKVFYSHLYDKYRGVGLTLDYLAEESAYFYFQEIHSFHFATELTSFEQRFYDYITHQQTLVYRLVNLCSQQVESQFSTDVQQTIVQDIPLMLNFWRLILSFYVLDGNYPRVTDFYEQLPYQREKTDIYDFLHHLFEMFNEDDELAVFSEFEKTMTPIIYYLIMPKLKESVGMRKINVQLLMENESLARRDLDLFLRDIQFVNIVEGDEDEQVDLIITTTPAVAKSANQVNVNHVPVISISGFNFEKEYYNLYQRLFNLYEH